MQATRDAIQRQIRIERKLPAPATPVPPQVPATNEMRPVYIFGIVSAFEVVVKFAKFANGIWSVDTRDSAEFTARFFPGYTLMHVAYDIVGHTPDGQKIPGYQVTGADTAHELHGDLVKPDRRIRLVAAAAIQSLCGSCGQPLAAEELQALAEQSGLFVIDQGSGGPLRLRYRRRQGGF